MTILKRMGVRRRFAVTANPAPHDASRAKPGWVLLGWFWVSVCDRAPELYVLRAGAGGRRPEPRSRLDAA